MTRIGIRGLRYVGFPFAISLEKFTKTRFDELARRFDGTQEVEQEEVKSASKLTFTTDSTCLKEVSHFIAIREKFLILRFITFFTLTSLNITSRGNWYHHSWKGDVSKSGGIAVILISTSLIC